MTKNLKKMKKLLLLFVCVIIGLSAQAEKITSQQALRKAQQFMQDKQFRHSGMRRAPQQQEGESPAYYVFNAEDDGGFVIVAGDDRMKDILGYAESGCFNQDSLPDNLKWLLDYYAQVASSLPAGKRMEAPTASGWPELQPLLTTTWDQGAPYNAQCPDMDGQLPPTGCVATAMAQVINYFQWPISEVRSTATYTTSSYQMTIPALPARKFTWSAMFDDEIAWLMRYCGQSIQMDYREVESSARPMSVVDALVSVFNYSRTVKLVGRESYSDKEWEELIYNELNVGRPVIYSGYAGGTMAGHSFVVHGYRNGMFCVNWGWGGQCDGYFAITNLSPNENLHFTEDQNAIISIQPSSNNDDSAGRVKEDRTIHLDKAGTLAEFIPEEEQNSIRKLKISGKLNTNDFRIIREMGHYLGRLESLDLSDATIVKGGNPDWDGFTTEDNVIGRAMFVNCNRLSEIILPNNITAIGGEAFGGSNISSIFIPKSVTHLDEGALGSCNNLVKIEVEEGNPVYYSEPNSNAVLERASGKLVSGCVTTRIPEGVTTIGNYSLWSIASLKSIKLPESLTTIEPFAFWGSWMSTLHLPKNVKSIGESSLYAKDMATITVDSENTVYDSRNNCNCLIETAKNAVILGSTSSKIPEGIVALEAESFINSNLSYIKFPQSLQRIGRNAFQYSNLRELDIPENVTEIGDYAFAGMENLKVVKVHFQTPINISDNVFENMAKGLKLIVPDGTKDKYRAATGWKAFPKILEESEYKPTLAVNVATAGTLATLIPEKTIDNLEELTLTGELNTEDFMFIRNRMKQGVLRIIDMTDARVTNGYEQDALCDEAFRFMHCLETVRLPKTLTKIGNFAFADSDIKSLVIPKTVTSIGRDIFYYCRNLSELSVEEGNPTFDSRENCNAINETAKNMLRIGCCSSVVPNSIVEIGELAFSGVAGLTSVDLPDGVKRIGNYAFWADEGLTSIHLAKTVVELGVGPFVGCNNIKKFTIDPENPIYDSRDNCNAIIEKATNTLIQGFGTTVIPETVEKIAPLAFQYQTFHSIDIPASVKEIGNDAFLYCNYLTTVRTKIRKPYPVTSSVFSGDNMKTATLYVPYGTKNAYATTSGWGLFPSIIEMEPTDEDYSLHAASVAANDFGKQYAQLNGRVDVPIKLVGGSIDPITSIDYTITTGNEVTEGHLDIDPITYMMTSEVMIPFQANATIGEKATTLTITRVNGLANETMEKSISGILVTVKRKPKYVPLVEEATGTWCGWCPRGSVGLKMLNKLFRDDVVTVAVHHDDPMQLPGYVLNTTNFPSCQINHGEFCDPYFGTSDQTFGIKRDVEAAMRRYTIGEMAMNAEWTDENQTAIRVNTTTTFVEDVTSSPYQIGYMLLEDKMTGTTADWTQSNYFANTVNNDPNLKVLVDSPSKIQGATFNYVPVAVWEPRTGIEGTLPATITSEVPMNYSYTLDIAGNTRIQNKERLTVVALLLNKETGEVVNAAKFKFTPDPDPSVVTMANYTRSYGDANPSFEYSVSGGALEGEPEIDCEATATSPAGEYPIIIKQGTVANEEVTYIGGTLTITKAPLTVTVEDVEREQGQQNPAFKLSYSGWKNGEKESVLTRRPVATTTATADSPVGVYDIVVSGGEAQNYELTYVNGKLTITVPSQIADLIKQGQTLSIYTLTGQPVRLHAKTLDGLTKGVYLVNGQKLIIK